MSEVWSSYKRKQVNINKAVFNSEVNDLMLQHYKYLHSLLVKSDSDEPIFNDTYLKLTYNYDTSKDFIEQFKYYFKMLKGAYYRDDKVANYYLDLVDDYEVSDNSLEEDFELDKPTQTLSDLKSKIQNYAISQKSYKRANKECKKGGQIENLPE